METEEDGDGAEGTHMSQAGRALRGSDRRTGPSHPCRPSPRSSASLRIDPTARSGGAHGRWCQKSSPYKQHSLIRLSFTKVEIRDGAASTAVLEGGVRAQYSQKAQKLRRTRLSTRPLRMDTSPLDMRPCQRRSPLGSPGWS